MASWDEYEQLACDDLTRRVGSARRTGAGPDGGVDVRADGYVAQVKATLQPIGRPDLQRLVGASEGDTAVFYALGGYSSEAKVYADAAGVALFEFTVAGEVASVNAAAELLGLDADHALSTYRAARERMESGPDLWPSCAVCGLPSEEWREEASDDDLPAEMAVPEFDLDLWVCPKPSCRATAAAILDDARTALEAAEQSDDSRRERREGVLLMRRCNDLIDRLERLDEDSFTRFDPDRPTDSQIARAHRIYPKLVARVDAYVETHQAQLERYLLGQRRNLDGWCICGHPLPRSGGLDCQNIGRLDADLTSWLYVCPRIHLDAHDLVEAAATVAELGGDIDQPDDPDGRWPERFQRHVDGTASLRQTSAAKWVSHLDICITDQRIELTGGDDSAHHQISWTVIERVALHPGRDLAMYGTFPDGYDTLLIDLYDGMVAAAMELVASHGFAVDGW